MEKIVTAEYGKDSEFYKKNKKMIQYSLNGFYRVFILWIIKYFGPIHGYEVMKEIDKFFEWPIKEGIIKKSTSSKVYPILKNMESSELIEGHWELNDEQQRVRTYSITNKGLVLLKMIGRSQDTLKKNSQWKLFMEDFHQSE